MSQRSRTLLPLYVGIFLDLFGFGMIFPDIQLRAEKLGAPGWFIGFLLASTFIVQFVVSPGWGKLSDRLGRKGILVLCTVLSGSGLLLYGFSTGLWLLLASRVVSGLGGANVAIAQAWLSDKTSDEDRTAAMGRLSAAISFGLIAGPVAGGFLAAHSSAWVGYAAGASSLLGACLMGTMLQYVAPHGSANLKKTLFFDLSLLKEIPDVRALAIIAVVAWFSLATLEGTFGRLIKHTLGMGQEQFGIVFGYESLLGFLVQAFLLGWIAKRTAEASLLRLAYVLQGVGLALTPFTYLFPLPTAWLGVLLFCSTLYALGAGFANPTINSLCSKLTPDSRQGELFGLLQGTRSIGFVVGPILGGYLFDQWFAAPYLVAGLTCILAAALVHERNKARTT